MKINSLAWASTFGWQKNKQGYFFVKTDPAIYAANLKGYVSSPYMFRLQYAVAIQNYQDHFVPSAAIGFQLSNKGKQKYIAYSLMAEWNFSFVRNLQKNATTAPNLFLVAGFTKRNKQRFGTSSINLQGSGAVAVLLSRRGELFDKGTIRVSIGTASLFSRTTIESVFYFHGFFKDISPGLRLKQSLN